MTLPIVERLREVEDHADVGCAEAADTIEELVEALGSVDRVALEQRCERGTPWDLACVTIARELREYVAPLLAKLNGASCAPRGRSRI
jgi:hypothetical protein